ICSVTKSVCHPQHPSCLCIHPAMYPINICYTPTMCQWRSPLTHLLCVNGDPHINSSPKYISLPYFKMVILRNGPQKYVLKTLFPSICISRKKKKKKKNSRHRQKLS
ncbi:mCG64511, partial [Mus musculus]